MLRPYASKDLMVDHQGDLIIKKQGNSADLVRTNNLTDAHTLAQAIYMCIKTDKGDFKYTRKFGASPQPFIGNPLTRDLLIEVERYVYQNLEQAGILRDNFPVTVKAVPMTRTDIAIRIEVKHPRDPKSPLVRIDMMYSTKDNSITPRRTSYGASTNG